MRKTPTIFDRDWEGNRGVRPAQVYAAEGVATEKLDGTNVRVTVRTDETDGIAASVVYAVRLEKRRNPTKEQKKDGITEPWYVDASRDDPADRFIFEALDNTSLMDVPQGEWSAEAVGPKIQGNPLGLDEHVLYFFDRDQLPEDICVPALDDAPEVGSTQEVFFADLRGYLESARSRVNPEVGIEGIVWHGATWTKLKRKDFK